MTQATEAGLSSLLRIPDFRRLWLGQIVSDFGDNLTFISILFVIQRLTGSTVALAGVTIAITVPSLVFGLLSGVYVDRLDRRRVMIVSDVVRGALVLTLVAVQSPSMVWLAYVVAFVHGSFATLFNPAKGALLPHIVGEERLLAANSISQTSRVIFNLLGTAAAGVFAGLMDDLSVAFLVDAITFWVSAAMISRISTTSVPDLNDELQPSVRRELLSGFKVMIGSRVLVGMLVGAGIAMLGIGAVNVLMVPFIVDELMVSESWFGLIEGGQVVGMVLSGLIVAALATRFRPTTLISVGLAGAGAMVAVVAGATSVWHLTATLFILGLFMTPLQSAVSTLAQTMIPDAMRGRVGAALNTLLTTATVTSMGFAGVAAAALGVRSVFIAAGAISIVAGAVAAMMFRDADLTPVNGRSTSEVTTSG